MVAGSMQSQGTWQGWHGERASGPGAQPPASASAEEGHILSRADSAAALGPRRKSESDLVAAAASARAESERLDFRDPCFIERQARPSVLPGQLALHCNTVPALLSSSVSFPLSGNFGTVSVTAGHETGYERQGLVLGCELCLG